MYIESYFASSLCTSLKFFRLKDILKAGGCILVSRPC